VTARLESPGQGPVLTMPDPKPRQPSERRRRENTAGIQTHALDAGRLFNTVEKRRRAQSRR